MFQLDPDRTTYHFLEEIYNSASIPQIVAANSISTNTSSWIILYGCVEPNIVIGVQRPIFTILKVLAEMASRYPIRPTRYEQRISGILNQGIFRSQLLQNTISQSVLLTEQTPKILVPLYRDRNLVLTS